MRRIIVYIVIIGNYDTLPKIVFDDGIEYYCFTDVIPENSNGWTCIYFSPVFLDNKLNAGYLKVNPHLLFPWDSIVLYIDSNLDVLDLTKQQILYLCQNHPITVLPHRFRNFVFGEAAILANDNLDNKNKIAVWEQQLKSMGFSDDEKLAENGFLIRDLRQPDVRKFNETWWSFLIRASRRDQLSFNPALWHLNLVCHMIKVDFNDSNRLEYFKFPFTNSHKNFEKRYIVNDFPALEISNFSPFCWTEMYRSANFFGTLRNHYFFQQELWTEKTLKILRSINEIIKAQNTPIRDNYFFIDKKNITEYSAFDIRLAWKREYLRKSILPSRWGIEVGFNHGHSAALMLGYNPNLLLIAIEPNPDKTTYLSAEKLNSVYNRTLEIYYNNPSAVLKDLSGKLPLEKIEFIHYNSSQTFEPSVFWGFMEWYLCKASLGCRLIISDHTPEIQQVLDRLLFTNVIQQVNPGVPDISDNKQYVKLDQMKSNTCQVLASMYSVATGFEKEAALTENVDYSILELNNKLQNQNDEFSRDNEALRNELQLLKNNSKQFENQILYYYRRVKNFLIKKNFSG